MESHTSTPGAIPPTAPPERYERYHLETEPAPHLDGVPPRFNVDVTKHRLAMLLLKELVHYRGNLKVVLDRPCVYGVFGGRLGGFAPIEEKCVGCLRCTTQYPDVVTIRPNPDRTELGDGVVPSHVVETVLEEAATGQVPVKGQGYRGPFGGEGWDGMWTDMSEIVRPTRDGIHGREHISTNVEVGRRPPFLTFDADGEPVGEEPRTVTLPLPILLDAPPATDDDATVAKVWARAAHEAGTLAVLPPDLLDEGGAPPHVVPLLTTDDADLVPELGHPKLVELTSLDHDLLEAVRRHHPQALPVARVPLGPDAVAAIEDARDRGVHVVHLTATYQGRTTSDDHVREGLQAVHRHLVEEGIRDELTLLGSGGIVAAEHVPKAIAAGLDAVALDATPLTALHASFEGEGRDRRTTRARLPSFEEDWAVQRLVNLLASWRDQLLEIMGAMGMREVRRLRGEMGRTMLQKDLEEEAFGDIPLLEEVTPHG